LPNDPNKIEPGECGCGASDIAPVADAGPDQTADEEVTVTLNGSGSSDSDNGIVSYEWTQTGGTAVTLSDNTVTQPTFAAPQTDSDGATLVFNLTVKDNCGLENSDEVVITIKDKEEDDGDDYCFISTAYGSSGDGSYHTSVVMMLVVALIGTVTSVFLLNLSLRRDKNK